MSKLVTEDVIPIYKQTHTHTPANHSLQKLAALIFIEGGNEKKKKKKRPVLGDSC